MTDMLTKWGDDVKVGEIDAEVFTAALVNADVIEEGFTLPADDDAILHYARKLRDHYAWEVAEKLGVSTDLILSDERPEEAEEALGECDACGGVSSYELPMCPYCGDADGGAKEGGEGEAPAAPAATAKPAAPPQEPAAKAPAKKQAVKNEGEDKGTKTAVKKEDAAMVTKATTTDGHAKDAKLEMNSGTEGLAGSEKKLDAAVKEIVRLKSDFFGAHWHLGHKVKEVYDSQLWKFRTVDGKVAYSDFDLFCKAEVGIGKSTAYKMMDIAADFTAKEVAEFGPTKLGHLLGLPPVEKAKLLEEIKQGASEREVGKHAKEVLAGKPRKTPRASPKVQKANAKIGKERTAAAKKGAAEMTSAGRITVAQIEGKKTIKLFAKPANGKKGMDPSEMKRARKVNDAPVGFFDLSNGVRQWFEVKANAAGELELVIETKRHED